MTAQWQVLLRSERPTPDRAACTRRRVPPESLKIRLYRLRCCIFGARMDVPVQYQQLLEKAPQVLMVKQPRLSDAAVEARGALAPTSPLSRTTSAAYLAPTHVHGQLRASTTCVSASFGLSDAIMCQCCIVDSYVLCRFCCSERKVGPGVGARNSP